MQIVGGHTSIEKQVIKQLSNLFFFNDEETPILKAGIEDALQRTEYCFSHIKNKYYTINNKLTFSPYHTAQYSIFLYYLSNSIWKLYQTTSTLSARVYALNKALHGLDLFYEIELPTIFLCDHPVGTVLGRADYQDFFYFSQNCTVGNNKGIYPTLGKNLTMHSGSKILGNCIIGENVTISANSYIKDTNIPNNSIVFGSSPNLVIKNSNTKSHMFKSDNKSSVID